MDVLLDTQAFLWFIEGRSNLISRVRDTIQNTTRLKLISIVSRWEIAIKMNKQKLILTKPFEFLLEFIAVNDFEILPIHINHLIKLQELSSIHGDPFDRLLIAQTIVENIAIVSADRHFSSYPVEVIW